jgi:pSer/pThr/pTyr-binding forkhead associated (FHA) protein
VLTDLESTNGTKVNGEIVQLRILRVGDTIAVGRSLLLFGSRDDIAERLAEMRGQKGRQSDSSESLDIDQFEGQRRKQALDFELNWGDDSNMQATMASLEPPELPERLSPAQAAQLAELLEYVHIRMRNLTVTARHVEEKGQVVLSFRRWQNLLDVHSQIAEYLRRVGNPE